MNHFYINWPDHINGYRPKEMLCEFLDFNNLKYSQMEDHQHFLRLVETESKNFILDRETFFVMIDDICNDTRRINSYKKHRYIFYQYLDGCPFYWLKNYKQKLHDYKKNQTLINSLSVSVLSDGYH